MDKRRIQVHVGTAGDMGRRFIDAWRRAERGERVREGAASVRQLAERLGRDYKNVHEDVERLTAAGLLEREDGRVTAPYETILAEMSLAS